MRIEKLIEREEARKNWPTADDFSWLDKELMTLGFGRISRRDTREDFERYKIVLTKPHPGGREEGYFYTHKSGYRAKVWTSFILADNDYRQLDKGWVIIVDRNDNIVYRAQVTRRTKNFAYNLLMRAKMALERTHFRPYCNEERGCGEWMYFIQRRSGACFWRCENVKHHGSLRACPKKGPDVTLSPEVKKFAEEKRLDRDRDRKDSRRVNPRGSGLGNYRSRFKKTRQLAH
jgi:hypothetical protein